MGMPVRENLTLVQGETFVRVIRLCSYLRSVSDAAINTASTTLNSRSGQFTSADVGRRVLIPAAGANGGLLDTTIASIVSSISVILSLAASNGVVKSRCRILVPVNLTGYVAKSQVRESEESATVLQEMVIALDTAAGKITRSILHSETALLQPGKYWHDLRLIDSVDRVTVRTRGFFEVLNRITED